MSEGRTTPQINHFQILLLPTNIHFPVQTSPAFLKLCSLTQRSVMSPSTMSSAQYFATKNSIDRCNGYNYAMWSRYMRCMFLTKSTWHMVNWDNTPTFANRRDMEEYVKTWNIAFGLMFCTWARTIITWSITVKKHGSRGHGWRLSTVDHRRRAGSSLGLYTTIGNLLRLRKYFLQCICLQRYLIEFLEKCLIIISFSNLSDNERTKYFMHYKKWSIFHPFVLGCIIS